MDEAQRRVREAAKDARTGDDGSSDDSMFWDPEPTHPLDEETLDERHSTQLGEMWEPRRRNAN